MLTTLEKWFFLFSFAILAIGTLQLGATTSVQFWIGDWINFGERKYGEKYKEAMEITGLKYQSLADMASVCANVKSSLRNENLH